MFSIFRSDFEVVKEGRISHLVSVYSRLGFNVRLIQGVAGSISAVSTNKIRHIQSQIVGVFFFTPGLRQVSDCFYENLSLNLNKGRWYVPSFQLYTL